MNPTCLSALRHIYSSFWWYRLFWYKVIFFPNAKTEPGPWAYQEGALPLNSSSPSFLFWNKVLPCSPGWPWTCFPFASTFLSARVTDGPHHIAGLKTCFKVTLSQVSFRGHLLVPAEDSHSQGILGIDHFKDLLIFLFMCICVGVRLVHLRVGACWGSEHWLLCSWSYRAARNHLTWCWELTRGLWKTSTSSKVKVSFLYRSAIPNWLD